MQIINGIVVGAFVLGIALLSLWLRHWVRRRIAGRRGTADSSSQQGNR
jgi:hypothetical protein